MQYKYKNIILTEEELNVVDQENICDSSNNQQNQKDTTPTNTVVVEEDRYNEMKRQIAVVSIIIFQLFFSVFKILTYFFFNMSEKR